MKRLLTSPQAHYVSDLEATTARTPSGSRARSLKFIGSLFLAFVFVFTAFISPIAATASADDVEDVLGEAAEGGAGSGPEGFEEAINNFGDDKNNSFSYVIERLFTMRYLNTTPEGVSAGDFPQPTGEGYNCDVDSKGAGTPYYHNCDVPNIVTEFMQDIVAMFTTQGILGGNVESVTLGNDWFGLPGNIPNEGNVPVQADQRSDKYTALELYGYNMRYTTYLGEWDHLKVFTSARAMSNFGFMDSLRLGTRSIINGITGGLEEGASNFADGISQGDILGAIGGAWTGLWGGGAAATINTVIDSSDLNVFNTFSWYRVGYGQTLYGARELSQVELSKVAETQMLDALSGLSDEDVTLPDEFLQLKDPPPQPKEAESRCVVTKEDGSEEPADGITEDACNEKESEDSVTSVSWTKDGAQKQETLKDWRDANKTWFEAAEKYNLDCTIDVEDEENRDDNIASFYECIPEAYAEAAQNQSAELKQDSVDEMLGDSLTAKFFADLLMSESGNSANFNAPWYRYVCTNANGSTMTDDDGALIYLMGADGTMDDRCSDVRAPIQNGLFGNGYEPEQTQPAVDTRNEMFDSSILSVLFPANGVSNWYANVNLGLISFLTQTSNTILNLSFSPILDTLGVSDMVEDLIVDFRESIFFPFAALVIVGSALYVFMMTLRTQAYREALKTILIITAVFVGGAILMFKPASVLNLADEVPSKVETAIMGTIFSVGNVSDDELCTASGSGGNAKGEGLEGEILDYAPEDGVRAMMCENWRVFLFNPWQYGQWGTSFENVYAADSGEDSTMNNTNGSLVGNAEINMGNDTAVQNWSLYQLDQMASGTSTTRDYTNGAGTVDTDMYRLVDLQAGPNNGEGTDSRYLEMWSGNDPSSRVGVSIMSTGVAILGFIVMVIYGLSKILVSFMTALMLLILPLIFLLGLIPNTGFAKLRNYFGTLAGLLIQRIMLVTLLAIMITMLAGITNSTDNYMMSMLGAAITCLAFIFFRKDIMDLIMKVATADRGPMISGSNVASTASDMVPRSVKNYGRIAGNNVSATASGAIGGFMVGGLAGAGKGMKDSRNRERNKLLNKQRTEGFGLGQALGNSARAGAHSAVDELRQSPNRGEVTREANARIAKGTDNKELGQKIEKEYNSDSPELAEGARGNIDAPAGRMPKASDARIMGRMQKAENDLQKAKDRANAPVLDDKTADRDLGVPYARRIEKNQERIYEENMRRAPDLETSESRFEKAMDHATDAEIKRHEATLARGEMRDSLKDMQQTFADSKASKKQHAEAAREEQARKDQEEAERPSIAERKAAERKAADEVGEKTSEGPDVEVTVHKSSTGTSPSDLPDLRDSDEDK